jgi:hypothetical protein
VPSRLLERVLGVAHIAVAKFVYVEAVWPDGLPSRRCRLVWWKPHYLNINLCAAWHISKHHYASELRGQWPSFYLGNGHKRPMRWIHYRFLPYIGFI